jgi:hypothetical protein
MTKVLIDQFGINLRRKIAVTVCELILGRHIDGVEPRGCPEPPWTQMHLMPPPILESLDLTVDQGRGDPILQITTADIFGIVNLHVMILYGNRNRIESGEAVESPVGSCNWHYVTTFPVPSGTSIRVHLIATDRLGGVGALSADRTIP